MAKISEMIATSQSVELFELANSLVSQFEVLVPSDDGTQMNARAGDVAEFLMLWATGKIETRDEQSAQAVTEKVTRVSEQTKLFRDRTLEPARVNGEKPKAAAAY